MRRASTRVVSAAVVVGSGIVVGGPDHVAGAGLPPEQREPEEVRRLADEILARREFAPPTESIVQRVVRWIGDRIGDLFEGTSNPAPGPDAGAAGGGGSALLTLLLLVVAVIAAGFVLRSLRGRLGRRRRTDDDDEIGIVVEEHRSVDEWDAAARRHEGAGEWKEGLRCRFRALVERLVGRGTVPDVAGRTAGEYRVDVRATLPEAADDFAGAVELFERAWYGDLPTGPEESVRFQRHAERVLTATGHER